MPLGSSNALRLLRMECRQRGNFDLLPVGGLGRRRTRSESNTQNRSSGKRKEAEAVCLMFRFIAAPPLAAAAGGGGAVSMMPDGAVVGNEICVGHAADVGFADFINAVDGSEQLAPVAVARLVDAELPGQAFVASPGRGSGWPWRGS